jgi:signal transduction histidine kinase
MFKHLRRREEDPAVANEIRRQQVRLLVSLVPTMSIVNVVNGLVLAAMFWNLTNRTGILVWYAVLLAMVAVQMIGWLRVRALPTPARVSGRSLNRSKLHAFLAGLVWGGMAWVFFPEGNVEYQMLTCVVVSGMAAGTTAMLNPIPALSTRFLLGILGPLFIRLSMEGSVLHLSILLLALILAGSLVLGSLRARNQLASMAGATILAEKARSDLEDAIESTNDAFALFDENRRLVTANTRFREWFANSRKIRGGDAKGELRRLDGGRWVVSTMRPTSRGGYVSVHVDVSDLKAREEELLAAKIKAEEADRAKTQFLTNMSHELRTPLNAIIGFSQMMRDQVFGVLGDARYRSYVDDIYTSGQHLLAIINDILDLSKIEFSRYELEYEAVELDEIVEWCLSICRGRDEHAGAREIRVEIDESAAWLEVDRRALKQMLVNLLSNALKFTPPDMPVGVSAHASDRGGVVISVWDKGIGIAPDKIKEVRKPFFQAENVLVKRYRGAGLGLAIVDSLARGHRAEMEIESVEGEGSTFNLYFPPERVCTNPAAKRRAAG